MSSVCYIVLTCEAYLHTRAAWQKKYCQLPNAWYLSGKSGPGNVHGWGQETGDDYNSCPLKYIAMFRKLELPVFDWYVFVDDDTFVFHERMVKELGAYDPNEQWYLGTPLFHLPPVVYMAGGSGFALSRPAFERVRTYVIQTDTDALRQGRDMFCGDVSIGKWIHDLGEIKMGHISVCHDRHDNPDGNFKRLTGHAPDLKKHATFHYMKTEEDFRFLRTFN
jgi:hypothetical protein